MTVPWFFRLTHQQTDGLLLVHLGFVSWDFNLISWDIYIYISYYIYHIIDILYVFTQPLHPCFWTHIHEWNPPSRWKLMVIRCSVRLLGHKFDFVTKLRSNRNLEPPKHFQNDIYRNIFVSFCFPSSVQFGCKEISLTLW